MYKWNRKSWAEYVERVLKKRNSYLYIEFCLRVSEEKAKYLTTRESKDQQRYFQIKNFNFEAVQSFTYLGPPHKC